jgi:hypothetical protein
MGELDWVYSYVLYWSWCCGVDGGLVSDTWLLEWVGSVRRVKVGELRALEGAALAVGFDIQGSWWVRL